MVNRRKFLKLAGLSIATGSVVCGLLARVAGSAQPDRKPNFVIIFTDDQGYGDVNCFHATEGYTTPHLDRMARQGMRFTDFSVTHAICTPSRASLLTGRYPERWGYNGGVFFPWSEDGMPSSEITLAEILRNQGYVTGHIGKWHLGHKPPFLPTNNGFDSYFGVPYSNDMSQDGRAPLASEVIFNEEMTHEDYLEYQGDPKNMDIYRKYAGNVPLMQDELVIEWPVDQHTLTKRYTAEAQSFIHQNRQEPFFLYFAHTMPHVPLYASEKFKNSTDRGLYGDVISEIDWSVGQILDTLRETGLAENTLVFFTSDNGPWLYHEENGGSSGPFRDGKGSTYEGGQRVPAIAWWPSAIPDGTTCTHHITTLDIFPTFARLAGAEIPQDRPIDGLDILPILKGDFEDAPRRDFFLYGKEAIRIGAWKYRRGPKFGVWATAPDKRPENNPIVTQLFNLNDDPGEQSNLAEQFPQRTRQMAQRLKEEYAKLHT